MSYCPKCRKILHGNGGPDLEGKGSPVTNQIDTVGREMEQSLSAAHEAIETQSWGTEEQTILNNLKMIDTAKEMWALENSRRNGAAVSKSDILHHFPGGFPTTPTGARYSIRTIGELPECMYMGKTYTPSY